MIETRRRGVHHGEARLALVRAAGELIEKRGATTLSLRQIAERAGLSHQAPYNHFASKEELLAELVVDGFRRLTLATTAAASVLPLFT